MKIVRFALFALDVSPDYENGKTPEEDQKEVAIILSRKDLLARKFVIDSPNIEGENIEEFESQLKKFITPEVLKEMVDEIEEGL
jgi:hypothetical protein